MPTQIFTPASISKIQANKSYYSSIAQYRRELTAQTQVNTLNTLIMEFDRVRIEFKDTYYPLQVTFSSTTNKSEAPLKFPILSEILKKSLRDLGNWYFKNKSNFYSFPRIVWRGTGTDSKSIRSIERRRDHFHFLLLLPLSIDLIPVLRSILNRNYNTTATEYSHRSLPNIFIDPVGHPVKGSTRNFFYYLARKEEENPLSGLEKIDWELSSIYGIFQRNSPSSLGSSIMNTISDCELRSIVLNHEEALNKFKTKLATPGMIQNGFSNFDINRLAPFEPPVRKLIQADEIVSLLEARADSKKIYSSILNSDDTKVHLIIATTGTGKSFLINKTPEYITKEGRIIIVSPRHDTIAEFTIGEKLPDVPLALKKLFNHAYMHQISPRNALKNIDCSSEETLQLKLHLEDYEKEIKRIMDESPIVLVTHARFLFMSPTQIAKFSTIIVDEDIVGSLLSPSKVSISQVQKLIQDIELTPALLREDILNRSKLIEKLTMFLASTENTPYSSPQFTKDQLERTNLEINLSAIKAMEDLIENRELTSDHLQSNLGGLLTSKVFQKLGEEIQFIPNFKFHKNIKIIVMTATPSIEAYKALFGDRLITHEVKKPTLRAKIIQDTSVSYSRFSLKDSRSVKQFNNLVSALVDRGFRIISYKDSHPSLSNHFGATTSDLMLENQNLAVIGTNNVNPDTFRLQCAYFGWDHSSIKNYDNAMNNDVKQVKNVKFNGYSFPFLTLSNDPMITQFQMELVSAELIQAVGRARPYEYAVTIYIYCRMPFAGASYL